MSIYVHLVSYTNTVVQFYLLSCQYCAGHMLFKKNEFVFISCTMERNVSKSFWPKSD